MTHDDQRQRFRARRDEASLARYREAMTPRPIPMLQTLCDTCYAAIGSPEHKSVGCLTDRPCAECGTPCGPSASYHNVVVRARGKRYAPGPAETSSQTFLRAHEKISAQLGERRPITEPGCSILGCDLPIDYWWVHAPRVRFESPTITDAGIVHVTKTERRLEREDGLFQECAEHGVTMMRVPCWVRPEDLPEVVRNAHVKGIPKDPPPPVPVRVLSPEERADLERALAEADKDPELAFRPL